jgi:hypothetical protein
MHCNMANSILLLYSCLLNLFQYIDFIANRDDGTHKIISVAVYTVTRRMQAGIADPEKTSVATQRPINRK